MPGEILLVDDDPLIRTVISDDLSDHDFSVHVAADEKQALAALDSFPDISVALVDYALPRPVGIGLCRRIAADYPGVAVALYTGHQELADVRLGDSNIPVLSKTMRIEQLVAAIEDMLAGRTPGVKTNEQASRVELLWKREMKRETVTSVGRAMHNQFDPTLREPLPPTLSDTVLRLFRIR